MFKNQGSYVRALLGLVAVALVFGVGCTSRKKSTTSNTLYLPIVEKIKGLDPMNASDLYSGVQSAYAFEGLLEYHYLKRPYQLMPNLAEAMPTVSSDGLSYTFKIRKGVVFQDDPSFVETAGKGRELIAEDFVYSWKRLADPKNLSEGWWIFDGKIKGLNEWREEASKSGSADYSKNIEGLSAPDRYTLVITLKQKSWQFLYYLAMPFSWVVPREAVEKYGPDFIRNPVGTGPFRLVRAETNLGSKIVWERNPTFREKFYPSEGTEEDQKRGMLADAGKRLPFADRIEVSVFVESQPQWLNFMDGKIDASGIPKDNFAQVINDKKELNENFVKKGIELLKDNSLDLTFVVFNMEDPVLGPNKYLRQAMSLAYNMGPVIDLFYNGRAIPAQGPIPPGLAGYDPNFVNPYRVFNIEKAKELLKKAGFPEGKGLPVFEYTDVASTTSRQMTEYLIKSMSDIGIKFKVQSATWPEFQKGIKNKKSQVFGYAWGADYPDAENFLQLFYSKNISPGPNNANYKNEEFDRLYEQSLKLNDSPERTRIYQRMVSIVTEDCPLIFAGHRLKFSLVHPWLKNYKVHEFEFQREAYLRVDAELRTKTLSK